MSQPDALPEGAEEKLAALGFSPKDIELAKVVWQALGEAEQKSKDGWVTERELFEATNRKIREKNARIVEDVMREKAETN